MTLKLGILGAAGIAPEAVIRPVQRRNGDVVVAAVAARSAASASAYAELHGIPRSYGSYRELIDDPEIDLVYVALPPSAHAEWSIAALEAGKHVLCEKPFALTAADAERMVAAAEANDRRLIEAFHDRYHPLSDRISAILDSGIIGTTVSMEAAFTAAAPYSPTAIRHVPELGGGALMDLGCYVIHWLRTAEGAEPTVVEASAVLNPLGTDESIDAVLRFPSGVIATLHASLANDVPLDSHLVVVGSLGTLEVDNMVFPHKGHAIRVTVDGLTRYSTVAGDTTYDHQLDAVVRAIETGAALPTEGQDTVDTMRAIEAIYASAGVDRSSFTG